ncbi:hypothetical protein ACRC6Q_04005 [Planococcus sp. SE5232]|uniref:hypothetical protein n=1 Tax=unclassified Planococcus (in: firmicutes) TaxID=2662419 RepID=UPI001CC12F02|nr:hypothetical protein [Planococcus sp. 4-30]
MGVQKDLWALRGICGRSNRFVVVHGNLWALKKIYGRSAELRPKSQMDESTKEGENPSKDGFITFFEKKKKREI